MKRLIFLGPPGAGKGTQAELLSQIYNIPHISTGYILREAIEAKTPLGQKAQEYVHKGELVPDELILDLIRERLSQEDARQGWILDGFPRNVSQAVFLDKLLAELDLACDCAINLEVPDSVLITRLLNRGRNDDKENTIRRRLEVYREQTEPVISYYQEQNHLRAVNGDRSLAEITESLKQIVDV